MNEQIMEILSDLPVGIGFTALGFLVLIVAKIGKDFLTPYKLDEQLTEKDNPALGLSMAGYYLGVIIIFLGTLHEPEDPDAVYTIKEYTGDLVEVFLYSLAGIILLNISRWVVDKLILRQFSTRKEIIEDRNSGTGAVQFGNYITSGLVIAGAFHGEGDLHSAALIISLGEAAQICIVGINQLVTRYNIHEEIEKDNVAAGVALGGNMIAIGIILLKGLAGSITTMSENVVSFAVYAVAGCVLLFAVRWTADLFMWPKATFDKEIAEDHNLAAALVESSVVIGAAAVIFFSL